MLAVPALIAGVRVVGCRLPSSSAAQSRKAVARSSARGSNPETPTTCALAWKTVARMKFTW
jgi:hypothetical protein